MKKDTILDDVLKGILRPRYHAGVGMLQAYLTESIRLHVWHPDLPQKLEAFGNRHNHRFDLQSSVLMGTIVDIAFRPEPAHHNGQFYVYEVMPAHYGKTPAPHLLTDVRHNLVMKHARRFEAGITYTIQRGDFHETRAEGLTVTLMRKSNQVETWARIVAHQSQEAVHGMDHDIPQHVLDQCFFSALRKLPDSAWEVIEKELANG